MQNEFYKEIKKRSREKFIALRSAQIAEKQTGVDIPAFIYAEQEYKKHLLNGNVDGYGQVKAGV